MATENTFEVISSFSTTTSDGAIDYRGAPADKTKTGGWKTAPFIIVNEIMERMAFFSIAASLQIYLKQRMHMSEPEAATTNMDFGGFSSLLTIIGAFVADAYLGRYLTMVIFSGIYGCGMVLLTFCASHPSLNPAPGLPATKEQLMFLYCALGIIALGTGGIKPCASTFGADQFDAADEKEAERKGTFFNWFFFAINLGAVSGILSNSQLAPKLGWGPTYGIQTCGTVLSVFVLVAGRRLYRYQRPKGSPITRFLQVLVAAYRNHSRGVVFVEEVKQEDLYEVTTKESDIVGARKLQHTDQFRFLDKAAVVTDEDPVVATRWKLCTVTQVEEFKSIIRLFPIFFTTIALYISFSQIATFFIAQSTIMNRRIIQEQQPGIVLLFGTASPIIIVPIYMKFVIPYLRGITGHQRGITSLQRMGVGLFISIVTMAIAAIVEKRRRESPNPAMVSVLWLAPQTFLLASADVFTYVGQLEFFYDEATDGTRSISSAFFLLESGLAHFICHGIVEIIQKTTEGWLQDDLNKSKLDFYYWILAAINAVNFVAFIVAAQCYKGRPADADAHTKVADDVNWDEEDGSTQRILGNQKVTI